MDLHRKIMSIKIDEDKIWESFSAVYKESEGVDARIAYKLGHHDARHAAAELAAGHHEYSDHEFCVEIKCPRLCVAGDHGLKCILKECERSAKDLHKWLKAKGFEIIRNTHENKELMGPDYGI